MRIRTTLGGLGAALVVAVALLMPVGVAQAAPAVPCRATATVANPRTNQTEPVYIATLASAHVTGAAYYRTTTTPKTGTTNARGHLYLYWRISHATAGYRVRVVISVASGSLRGTCSTFFTPAA
jgi:hypothetical protein